MANPLDNPEFRAPGLLENFLSALFGKERAFDTLQIEVSSYCNGGCDYCPQASPDWKKIHMEPDTFARLWPVLRNCKRSHLQGWGEPLLNPHFFEFEQFARKAGCQTSTTTSGRHISSDLARKLAQSGMDVLAVSLAGTDEASNSCRKNVPFENVCESLRTLRKALNAEKSAMKLHIAYLLLADRMDAVKALPELMEKYDIDASIVSTLDYLAFPRQKTLAILPHETEKLKRARELLENISSKAESMGRSIFYDLPGEQDEGHLLCHEYPDRSFYIDAEGNVSPCIYLNVQGKTEEKKIFGNIRDLTPPEIWRQPDYADFRNQLRCGNPSGLCLSCAKRYI